MYLQFYINENGDKVYTTKVPILFPFVFLGWFYAESERRWFCFSSIRIHLSKMDY